MHADIGAIASALKDAGLLVEQRGGSAADVVVTDVTDDSRVVSDGAVLKVYEAANKQMFEQNVDKSQYPAALSFLTPRSPSHNL